MKCPKCNSTHSRVVDSRHADEANAIRRRRECENCGTRFTTFEHRSCEKRPVRYQQLEDITNKVEWQLRDEGQTEISSREIGEHVMNLLMHVDQVSYVRFASVYKEFKDVDQLLESMQGILSDNKRSDK